MNMTEGDILREVADIRSLSWPMYPVLPMKKRPKESITSGFPEFGCLFAFDLKTIWKHDQGVMALTAGLIAPQLTEDNGWTKVEYKTTEAMVRDGWIGD